MRALTCYPQWAHAVAYLGKRIENRGRPIPPALVGERIAIHAGATLPPGWGFDLAAHAPEGQAYTGDRCSAPNDPRVLPRVVWWRGDGTVSVRPVVTRSIVATAIVRPHEPSAAEWMRARFEASRPSNPSRTDGPPPPPWADPDAAYWWALSDVQRLVVPVPVRRGQLGLWRLTEDEAAAVDAAAKEAA